MKKAVTYARYSTDIQQDRSIADQNLVCDRLAEHNDLNIVERFSDRGKSGATRFDRDGLQAMMDAARARKFEVLIVENLERLARDEEDLPHIYKRLTFAGIQVLAESDGWITPLHIQMRGMVGSMQLDSTRRMTRRGHGGRAKEGKVPGSVAYGYRIVLGKKGEPEINPDKAKIVRRIYAEYLKGASPRAIAIGLTRDGIPAPAGGRWNAPTIAGGGTARYGILTNPMYVGRIVWNKNRQVRNPDNGKKVKRATPDNQVEGNAERLRIIDQETWDAAQALRASRARVHFGPSGRSKRSPFLARSKHLLADMLRCGVCGGHMRIRSMTRGTPWAACAAADAHDACSHKHTYDLDRLQRDVLAGMKKHLLDPEAFEEATRAYRARRTENNKRNHAELTDVHKQLSRVEVQIDRLVDAITNSSAPIKALTAKLDAAEAERGGLAKRLQLLQADTNVVELHPSAIKIYKANIVQLHKALSENALRPENRVAFRNLIDSIVVHPTGKRMPYEFSPYGRPEALMSGVSIFATRRTSKEILQEQGFAKCDKGKPLNSGLAISHKVVSLGRWRAVA
jgi:site-specific DNA recombinase